MLHQTEDYANKFCQGMTRAESHRMREGMGKYDLRDFEITQIINLRPRDVEEAVALIPSLSKYGKETLERVMVEFNEELNQ